MVQVDPGEVGRWDRGAPRHMFLIGNPENRRISMLQAALSRHGWPRAVVASYSDVLAAGGDLSQWLSPTLTHVRLESPGENVAVERELLAWGAEEDGPSHLRRVDAEGALALPHELGRIRFSYQWFLGYRRLLRTLEAQLCEEPHLCQLNPPDHIAAMFDKVEAHRRLEAHGVPGPMRLAGGADVSCFDELRALMEAEGCRRAFVKLRTGSSASGVVAYRFQGAREEAVTSTEVVEGGGEVRLYNSLQIRRYRSLREIRTLFDALLPEGVVVERWLPKASWEGYGCDLRVVVIAREARHVVLRMSRSPMTNLHLGNRRGDVEGLRETLGDVHWAELMGVAASALGAFEGFHCAGIDLLCTSGFRHPRVLEINAFGDLLPNVVHRGEDTYGAQILALG